MCNNFLNNVKENVHSTFLTYITELEQKNLENEKRIHTLTIQNEKNNINYVNLEADFDDLKKVSHVKNLDKQLCDALRDIEILKKKLEKYEKKPVKNDSIKTENEKKTSKNINSNTPTTTDTKNKKKKDKEEIDELIYEDIEEYVNEYINNNIIVHENDVEDIINNMNNIKEDTIKDSDTKNKKDKKKEKKDTKIEDDIIKVEKSDDIIKIEKSDDIKIDESNDIKIDESNDIKVEKIGESNDINIEKIGESNDIKVEKSEDIKVEKSDDIVEDDEIELIEKKVGKIIYYITTDTKQEVYEKLENGDVGNLIGNLITSHDKNGKKKDKIVYTNN